MPRTSSSFIFKKNSANWQWGKYKLEPVIIFSNFQLYISDKIILLFFAFNRLMYMIAAVFKFCSSLFKNILISCGERKGVTHEDNNFCFYFILWSEALDLKHLFF